MKNSYKIVASDLDGTLLDTCQRVSAENLDAIAEMNRRGISFVPATGRTLSEIPKEIMNSSAIRYIITSSGAAVWDKQTEKMVITRCIPKELVKFILDTVLVYNVYPLVHKSGKNHYDATKHNESVFESCRVGKYFQDIINETGYPISDYYDFTLQSDDVEMFCIFFESDEAQEKCRRIFLNTGKLCVAKSDPHNLEICFSEAGKGSTLKALADSLGVSMEDTVAIGDSANDISLLKAAGLALAMDNAYDELKAIADKVICNNDEHSARYILDNFILDN